MKTSAPTFGQWPKRILFIHDLLTQ
jgi:hypothetical protein